MRIASLPSFACFFALGLAVSACSSSAPPPREARPVTTVATVAPKSAERPTMRVSVTYREAANAFEILDNVSKWSSDKCDAEYRDEWKTRFGLTSTDLDRFARYKAIRMRAYPTEPPTPDEASAAPSGLFAPKKPPDLFAEAFYSSTTLSEALEKLAKVIPAEDARFVSETFASYSSELQALLDESRPLVDIAASLERELDAPSTSAFYADVARFYGLDQSATFTVLFVWWPPVPQITANNRGSTLLMKYNPSRHRDAALHDVDIPVHEMIHFASAHQSDAKKQSLTRAFLSGPCRAPFGPKALEEPMAVAQQKLFLGIVHPERFELESKWYGSSYVSGVAKALFPAVRDAYREGRPIDDALMTIASDACGKLMAKHD